MKQTRKLRCGCVAAAAMAAAGNATTAVGGAFTENTNYATPGRAPGAPTDTAHAPYGWIGVNGAKTWELYRKYEPDSYVDPTGNTANDQLGVTITNDASQSTHAVVHNETSNFTATPDMSASGSWNGPGLWIGPTGANAFPSNTQLLVANPVSAGAPQNMEIRMGFVMTADLANLVYNPAAGVGSAADGGDGRSASQNGGTRQTSHSDFYGGYNPGPGADMYYLHVAVSPTGQISGTNGYGRSGDNPNNESGATAVTVTNPDGTTSTAVTETGTPGPGPYAISSKLVANPASPTGWSLVARVGGYSATFDLPDLTMDPSGIAFHAGMFDPNHVTPALYAQDSQGSGDYADADVYATIPGDINLDGKVNFADLLVLAQHYGMQDAGWTGGDLNGTGTVDFSDLLTLAQNYGAGTGAAFAAVPEPATFGLGLMGLGMLARRRKQR